jgi:hypothetical protein
MSDEVEDEPTSVLPSVPERINSPSVISADAPPPSYLGSSIPQRRPSETQATDPPYLKRKEGPQLLSFHPSPLYLVTSLDRVQITRAKSSSSFKKKFNNGKQSTKS